MIKKFLSKVEDCCAKVTTAAFVVAMVSFSLGMAIWSVKWVLSLLGVM